MSDVLDLASLRAARQDPDLQAGSRGLRIGEVTKRYFRHSGDLLALLRRVREKDIAQLSAETGIDSGVLLAYESGARAVSLKDTVTLANTLKINLRPLMEALGNIKEGAPAESMGIAAQFTGDLTEGEKLDLQRTVAAFAAARRKGSTDK